jgi:hypothetical protein
MLVYDDNLVYFVLALMAVYAAKEDNNERVI